MPPIRRNHRTDQNTPSPVKSTTILDLNDHCLLDIFRFLSPLEMCSVFDTCKWLRHVAHIHMRTVYRSNELILSNEQNSGYKMMCKFGSTATKLRIDFLNSHHQRSKVVVSWLRKLQPKLESLTLVDSNFNAGLQLSPLLKNLRRFRIEYVIGNAAYDDIKHENNIKEMLKNCENIEELSIGSRIITSRHHQRPQCHYQGIFLQQKFKQLRSLEVYGECDFDINNLKLFLRFNRNIQSISLKRCISVKLLGEFNLSQYAPNIKALALQFRLVTEGAFYLSLTSMLSHFENLKCLALDTCYTDVTNFIASMARRNSLIYLSLNNVRLGSNEELSKAFFNMTNLKVLRLEGFHYSTDIDDNFFKCLCKNLTQLEELHLCGMYLMQQQIADIIENSINLKKIYFPHMMSGVLDENVYGNFVEMQRRKSVPFPLTIFFANRSHSNLMFHLRGCSLNRDVIDIAKFYLSDFDSYSLPHSEL